MKLGSRWTLVALCVILAGLVLAACGGDDSTSSGTTADTGGETSGETSGEAPSGDPVKIMAIGPLSGTTKMPGIEDGAKAAAQAINEEGGIGGRPVEIIACNEEYDPNKTQACAREAVAEEVLAVTGLPQVGASLMPALEQAGIPAMTAGASPDEFNSEFWFPPGPGYAPLAFGVGSVWCSLPAERVVLFNLDVEGALVYQDLYNEGIESCGKKFVDTQLIPLNASDVTPFVTKALQSDPDGAYLSIGQPFNFKVAEALHSANPDMTIATNYTSWDFGISEIEGLLYQQLAIPAAVQPENEYVKQFNEEYEAYSASSPASESSELTWTAVHVVANFAEEVGEEVNAESLVAAFREAGPQQFGPMPPWDWSKPFKIGDQTAFGEEIAWAKFEDGKVQQLFDTPFTNVMEKQAQ